MRRLFVLLAVTWPAQAFSADSLADAKDSVEMMISSAYVCSEYRHDPAILADLRNRARAGLIGAGMTAAESDSFMDRTIDSLKAKQMTEAQKQAACEMINIPVIK